MARRLTQAELSVLHLELAGGGNPDALRDWYNEGADGKIDWGSPGDWQQCVDVASNYMDDDQAKGFCELRHEDATGMSTAEHAHEEKSSAAGVQEFEARVGALEAAVEGLAAIVFGG